MSYNILILSYTAVKSEDSKSKGGFPILNPYCLFVINLFWTIKILDLIDK